MSILSTFIKSIFPAKTLTESFQPFVGKKVILRLQVIRDTMHGHRGTILSFEQDKNPVIDKIKKRALEKECVLILNVAGHATIENAFNNFSKRVSISIVADPSQKDVYRIDADIQESNITKEKPVLSGAEKIRHLTRDLV